MSYVSPPTPATVKAQFPEFAGVEDARVQFWLDRAARSVDTSWPEPDFDYGRMLLAAHYMVTSGLGTSAEATSVNDGSAQFRAMRIGSLSLERFDNRGGGAWATYGATRYGREYRALLRQVKGGPRVTGGGAHNHMGDGDTNFGPWTQ